MFAQADLALLWDGGRGFDRFGMQWGSGVTGESRSALIAGFLERRETGH